MRSRRTLAAICLLAIETAVAASAPGDDQGWISYGGDHSEQHFSALTQVNRDNVERLGLAWAYDVPDAAALNGPPLVVNGVLFFSADRAIVHAVDARTGKPIWSYDPQSWKHSPRGIAFGFNTNRGLAYWQGRIGYPETSGYVRRIPRNIWIYRAYYAGTPVPGAGGDDR